MGEEFFVLFCESETHYAPADTIPFTNISRRRRAVGKRLPTDLASSAARFASRGLPVYVSPRVCPVRPPRLKPPGPEVVKVTLGGVCYWVEGGTGTGRVVLSTEGQPDEQVFSPQGRDSGSRSN